MKVFDRSSAVNSYFVVMFAVMIMISVVLSAQQASGAISLAVETRKMIDKANQNGPYLGLVIPNLFEMNPLISSPDYTPDDLTIDISGKI